MTTYYCESCNSSWSTARINPIDPEMPHRLCSECARIIKMDQATDIQRLQDEIERLKQERDGLIPSVVPTNKGIQFEWHVAGIDLEMEFVSPSAVELFIDDNGEDSKEFDHADFQMIQESLNILRRKVND